MNGTERLVVKELAKSLSDSSQKPFNCGDLDDWFKFAKKMQQTIHTAVPILEKLVNENENQDKT